MDLHRLSVKRVVRNPDAVDLDAAIPMFHKWIQGQLVEGLLIDVANYAHVQDGPGIMLIGHDIEYALDQTGGELGMLARQKRGFEGDLATRLRDAYKLLDAAAKQCEADSPLRFDASTLKIMFEDRLRMPNNAETFDAIRSEIEALAKELLEAASVTLTRDEDPRRMLSITVQAEG